MTSPADPDWLAARFEEQRPRLWAVAYRMLGSTAEAEDTVQDAWLRVARADAEEVRNLAGWLTTIVARLALDRLRARAARREDPTGVHLPDPVVTSGDSADPAREAELADAVGLALLVVLDRLSPPERLAFVLHDTFGLSFVEVGRIVDRSPVAARQLASRARRRVRAASSAARSGEARSGDVESGAARSADSPSGASRRELVEAFFLAARAGDFEALVRVLDPDVIARADLGPTGGPLGTSRVIRGSEAVARSALGFRSLAAGARRVLVNGTPGFVVFVGDRPFAVLAFSTTSTGIAEIDILADPARLGQLDLSAIGPVTPPGAPDPRSAYRSR